MRKNGLYCFLLCIVIFGCKAKITTVDKESRAKEITRNKTLKVKEIEFEGIADFQDVSRLLDEKVETHFVDVLNWADFPYQPKVGLRLPIATTRYG